jgi:hypothetical protein
MAQKLGVVPVPAQVRVISAADQLTLSNSQMAPTAGQRESQYSEYWTAVSNLSDGPVIRRAK